MASSAEYPIQGGQAGEEESSHDMSSAAHETELDASLRLRLQAIGSIDVQTWITMEHYRTDSESLSFLQYNNHNLVQDQKNGKRLACNSPDSPVRC